MNKTNMSVFPTRIRVLMEFSDGRVLSLDSVNPQLSYSVDYGIKVEHDTGIREPSFRYEGNDTWNITIVGKVQATEYGK